MAKQCTQVIDKILRQILYLLPTETKSGPIHFVTLLEPIRSLVRIDWTVGVNISDARENFLSDQLAPTLGSETPVWLSNDMLGLEMDIFQEIQEYLTDAERAGKFYIDASDYFNQISNMCMERFRMKHFNNSIHA